MKVTKNYYSGVDSVKKITKFKCNFKEDKQYLFIFKKPRHYLGLLFGKGESYYKIRRISCNFIISVDIMWEEESYDDYIQEILTFDFSMFDIYELDSMSEVQEFLDKQKMIAELIG